MKTPPSSFASADEAWLYLLSEVKKGKPLQYPATEIFKVVERLYQKQTIDREDLWLMRVWGRRGCAPTPWHHGPRRVWNKAMAHMEFALREKGIVV